MTEVTASSTPATFKSEATLPGFTIFTSKTGSLSLDKDGYLSFVYRHKTYFKIKLEEIQSIGFHDHQKYDQYDTLYLRVNNNNYRFMFVTQEEMKDFAVSSTIGAAQENKLASTISAARIVTKSPTALRFMNRKKIEAAIDELDRSKQQIATTWVRILSPYTKPDDGYYGRKMHRRDAIKAILTVAIPAIIGGIVFLGLTAPSSQ